MSRKVATADPLGDYPTPGWCVDRLLESECASVLPREGIYLEPTAGAGRIIERFAASDRFTKIRWQAWDIQARHAVQTSCTATAQLTEPARCCDALKWANHIGRLHYDCAITNPPYSLALPILQAMRRIAKHVVLLLRVNFMSSEERLPYWQAGNYPHTIAMLPNRPKFVNGKSDSTEYGWFIWGQEPMYQSGLVMLASTPLEERKQWERPLDPA